jgi:hypothetical protein
MERYVFPLYRGRRPGFDALPASHRRRVFDVDYAWVRGLQGGEMFFTRHGWAIADALLPEHWFDEGQYRQVGRALAGATGAVYHVPVAHPRRARFGLVVKFSRFAQDVGLTVVGSGAGFGWPEGLLDTAAFADPFSEFANVQRLRARGRVRTKRPLAIYCPAAHYPAWQLGREPCHMALVERALVGDQAMLTNCPCTELERERIYILVYQWIDGIDLEEAARHGAVTRGEMEQFTQSVAASVLACGFAVLDHKPRHIILRQTRCGDWLRCGRDWAWALVDYELLIPVSAPTGADAPVHPSHHFHLVDTVTRTPTTVRAR